MKGFTLVELIIVIGLSVIIVGSFAILGNQIVVTQELERAKEIIKSELSNAQIKSIGGTDDSAWGVVLSPNQITSFRGTSFATRNVDYDRVINFSGAINISGANEIVFNRIDGSIAPGATITISSGSQTNTISINKHGAIELQ